MHEDFKDYRDTEIQKWNDRTKISSGKFATSNFSAFDQPTLKQIEQILSDKPRLIRRTQTKRTKYRICSLQSRDQVLFFVIFFSFTQVLVGLNSVNPQKNWTFQTVDSFVLFFLFIHT